MRIRSTELLRPSRIDWGRLGFQHCGHLTAGFIDNEVGKVICTDENMAAAGGNNWLFDIVQLYNPDFHLDPSLQAEV